MYDDDILQPVTNDADIIKLRNSYKDVRPSASHIYNYLSAVIRRRTVEPNSTHFTILVPYGKIENGTFLGIEKGAIVMYTLEEGCTTLLDALNKTKRFNWSDSWVLYSIVDQHCKSIVKVIEEKGFEIRHMHPCGIYWMAKEKAINLTISCPEDVYIAPLEMTHVEQINNAWPNRFSGSEKYIGDIVEFGGGYGVFLKSNNLLVAWALHNIIGIGNIQTEPEYMKQGYGSLIGKYISKKIAERGCDSLGTIISGNLASETMFTKLGFECVQTAFYIYSNGHPSY